jgi:hypothetical protein
MGQQRPKRGRTPLVFLFALAALVAVLERSADAHPDVDEEDPALTEDAPDTEAPLAPASRYGALDAASCLAELKRRKISFEPVAEAPGVVTPLRLTGPLADVTFRSNLPASRRRTSPYEIYDCRLVLALEDFARILARHDVVEVVHLSVYRPSSKKRSRGGPARRHPGALAIDAAWFRTRDGRTLTVEKDFDGRRGERPCGARAKPSPSELRAIVCQAASARLFNVVLTPGFNRAHRNHFHLEVTAGARWVHVR